MNSHHNREAEENYQRERSLVPIEKLDGDKGDISMKIHETCPICFSEVDELYSPLNCNHGFCLDCYRSYLKEKIDAYEVLNIKCMQDGCQEVFMQNNVKMCLEQELYEKYERFVFNKLLSRNNKVRFCPKPGCSKELSIKQNSKHTICICETKVCNECFNEWHEGKTCLEAMDVGFAQFSQDNDVRRCVMCKSMVTRVEGCAHIKCPICDYEWCWWCGREYNSWHQRKCPRVWSPMPPERLRKFYKLKMAIKIILFTFFVLPFLLLIFLLEWTYVVFGKRNFDQVLECHMPKKIILHGILGVILLPITIAGVAIWIACFTIILPCIIVKEYKKSRRSRRFRRKPLEPRWLKGQEQQFHYTRNAEPTRPREEEEEIPRRILFNLVNDIDWLRRPIRNTQIGNALRERFLELLQRVQPPQNDGNLRAIPNLRIHENPFQNRRDSIASDNMVAMRSTEGNLIEMRPRSVSVGHEMLKPVTPDSGRVEINSNLDFIEIDIDSSSLNRSI